MAQSQASLPTVDEAKSTLYAKVAQAAFFDVLARHGVVPKTASEAKSLVAMGVQLRAAREQQEAIHGEPDRFKFAHDRLNDAIGASGLGSASHQAAEAARDQSIKHAAAYIAADPEVYNAVLTLKADEAARIQQLGQR